MTKDRLRNYGRIKREREQLLHQLQEVEAELYSPKIQRLTGMPSGGKHDGNPQENLIAHHIELQKRYLEKIDELAAEQLAIEQAIETLDGTLRSLMRFRYIDGLVWEEVCVKMNYSWRQIHNLHGRALCELAKNTA